MPRHCPDRLAVCSFPPLLLPGAGGREPDPDIDALRDASAAAVRWLLDDSGEPPRIAVLGADPVAIRPAARYRCTTYGLTGEIAIDPDPGRDVIDDAALATLAAVTLLNGTGATIVPVDDADRLLVIGGGSARRRDGAPGWVDARAIPYDDRLAGLLAAGDIAGIAGLDLVLADQLLADLPGVLAPYCRDLETPAMPAVLDYYDAPYGVAYYVARWGR